MTARFRAELRAVDGGFWRPVQFCFSMTYLQLCRGIRHQRGSFELCLALAIVPACLFGRPLEKLPGTGVDAAGQLLPVGALEEHYDLQSDFATERPRVLSPMPEWVAPPSGAQWIGVGSAQGNIVRYFDLHFEIPSGADLDTVTIRGRVSGSDNVQLVMNRNLLDEVSPPGGPDHRKLWAFEIRADAIFNGGQPLTYPLFRHGDNLLSFHVGTRQGEPVGLLVVDLAGDYSPQGRAFRRGDVNGDGSLAISDPILLLTSLFLEALPLACEDAADTDDDGAITISDAVGILGYMFLGTLAPPAPFHACGDDAVLDDLACKTFLSCR